MATPAEYTVVARRYRPQQLTDLIGQEHVVQALTNALAAHRVAHAYLFTGARGVGKTSAARILAKCLNCETGPTATPCDKCEICLGIISGDDVDVLEIDGASNNKVDEARDLRSNINFRPARARYKIYIIDEVHMVTTQAFNALLKTLEEPPPHVKFIFATTEKQKIPITILSRCQTFEFATVKPAKIFEQLKRIVGIEGLKADDEALHVIARRAAGSMRDSQSLLDQLLAFADGTLTAEKIHALLGTASDERVFELADAILTNDAKRAVESVAAFADRGLQLGELADQLVDYWRGLMLVQVAGADFPDLPGTPAFQEKLKAHAVGRTLDTILAGLDVLTTAKAKMRGSPHVGTLLEMAVVRLARLEELLSLPQLIQAWSSTPAVTTNQKAVSEPVKKNSQTAHEPARNGAPSGNSALFEPVVLSAGNLPQVHEQLLDILGPLRGNQLRNAGLPAIRGPNSLVFRFPASYSAAYDYCGDDKSLEMVRAALKKLTGTDWLVRVELAPATAAEKAAPAPVKATTPAGRSKEVALLPLFKKAADVLGAQLVKVDDGFNPTAVVVVTEPEADTPAVLPDSEDDEP